MKPSIINLLVVGILCTAGVALGQPFKRQSQSAGSSGQGIGITADKLSSEDGGSKIEASGNVEIQREGTTLKADQVEFDRNTQDVRAKGNVSVDDPEWKVKSADSLQLNMENETGEFQKADLFIEQGHLSLSGQRFQKFTGQSYHIEDGFFTTCFCDPGTPSWAPTWKFSAQQMDLSLEGLGVIRNGYFYVMDIPIFYLPYGVFPLNSERQSGFLTPRFGHSTSEGFRFQQPFYWAPSKSTDATVTFDIESNARVGGIGQFRTKFNQYSDLTLNGSYFNEVFRHNADQDIVDKTIANPHIPQDRWSMVGTHRYPFASDWLTFSDIATYSDDLFTRELVDRFDLPVVDENVYRVSRFSDSTFGVFRGWYDSFFKTQWNFYQDFMQSDSLTPQRTPQVSFWGQRLLTSLPLQFLWRTEAVNYIRKKEGDGLRVDLRPELVYPFRMAPYFYGNVSIAPRETAYHLYTTVQANDHNVSRELVELRWNIGSSFSRVYKGSGGTVEAIKHIVEPEISYLFIPGVNQSRIPLIDDIDRIRRRNVITFALDNRLWGKFARLFTVPESADQNVEVLNPGPSGLQELVSLRMAMSYDINRARKGADSLSDIDTRLLLTPTTYASINLTAGINPGAWNLSQAGASFNIHDPRIITRRSLDADFQTPSSFSIGYQFLRKGPNGFLAEDANINLDAPPNCAVHGDDPRCPGATNKNIVGNLSSSLNYHVTDNILVFADGTYDVRDTRFIGINGALKFLSPCDCWTATVRLSHNINPAKTSFNFSFNLLGLGSQSSNIHR